MPNTRPETEMVRSSVLSRDMDYNGCMGKQEKAAETLDLLKRAIQGGLSKAYSTVQIDPQAYLQHLRRAHGLPILGYRDMFRLPVAALDHVALQTI